MNDMKHTPHIIDDIRFYKAPSSDGSFIVIKKWGEDGFYIPEKWPYTALEVTGVYNLIEIENYQSLNNKAIYGEPAWAVAERKLKHEISKFAYPILDWLNKILKAK